MLLRSSSASIVQPIFSDNTTRDFDTNNDKTRPPHVIDNCTSKVSFVHGLHHLSSFSCNSSPAYLSTYWISKSNRKSKNSIRRAKSESNLEGLDSTSFDFDQVGELKARSNSLDKGDNTMLHSEPSFAIYNTDEVLKEIREKQESVEKVVKRDGSSEFCFEKNIMGLIEEDEENEDEKEEKVNGLMKDLVIKEKGESGNSVQTSFDDDKDVGEYYKRILEEEPFNALLLRNYAQFLQSQGDLSGAEEYYYRATLADPNDGEILMQYAKLVWELHHDQKKASTYFERAVYAASEEDSHVHAAYASFLWEIEESDEEDILNNTNIKVKVKDYSSEEGVEIPVSPPLHLASGLGINAIGFGDENSNVDYAAIYSAGSGNIEDYYKKMVVENPNNPLFLKNYADFICQSEGDLEKAEELYYRAIIADPKDGETISEYAKLVWKLHRDKDKALSYFHRAVKASPINSNVLAAYAGFLWEAGEDEDEEDEDENDIILENHAWKGATTMASG